MAPKNMNFIFYYYYGFFSFFVQRIRSNWEVCCNVQTRDNIFTFHTLTQCVLKTPSAPSTPTSPLLPPLVHCTCADAMVGCFFSPFFLRLCCLVLYSCQNKMYWRVSGPDNRLIFTLFEMRDHVLVVKYNPEGESLTLDVTLKSVLKLALDQVSRLIHNYQFLPSRFKVAVGSWTHTTLFDWRSPDLTGIGTTDVRI